MIREPEVHCWRTVHEVRINQKLPASAVPILFQYRQPNFVGPLGECRVFAHEQSVALGLPSFVSQPKTQISPTSFSRRLGFI